MPRLSVLQNDYGPHGFAAISINLSEDMEAVVKPWARQNTNLYLRDDGSVWSVYSQHNAIPTNYVIDTAGVIRYWTEGFEEQEIRNLVQSLIPDPIAHDVGVKRIVAPSGSLDSGTVVTPACSVYNFGSNTETYTVRMRIGSGYDTAVLVSGNTPGAARYVEFPTWTALERGQLAVTCTTELAGDDIGSNNVVTGEAIVNVRDIAVTLILAPQDTVDSGASVVPMAEVRNLGTVADMAKVRFYIGSAYIDSVSLPIQPGRCDTAVLPSWTATEMGTLTVRCTAAMRLSDMVAANNQLTGTVVVQGLGVAEAEPTAVERAVVSVRPNPAGRHVTIEYSLPKTVIGSLRILSADGILVRTLLSGSMYAGRNELVWDGRDDSGVEMGPGKYYCRLIAGHTVLTRPVILAR